MNIKEIINKMNSGETITMNELTYFEENYVTGVHPWVDLASLYTVVHYDGTSNDVEFHPEIFMPEGDDYSPIDDGSWYGR